ncbi:MAG: glyceraldehyde 3-phosphate dehydrogenase NAD-binding domain-containing protein, partial [Balneolaceae bacterium]|nr:glyceraldehyde 3-phosphate dehydrogenase NAD-binding domain-containing protein [Balneolaceae bacterium]
MAKIKVGINGFGRIGRLVMRSILKYQSNNIEVVGINDLTDAKTLAHLFKYDTAQGKFDGEVYADGNDIVINGKKIGVSAERDPANLKWGERGAEVIVESTGIFRNSEKAGKHIEAGAKKVIISAPASGSDIQTIVLGVNDSEIDKSNTIFSNASCTTNCLAPTVKVLDSNF